MNQEHTSSNTTRDSANTKPITRQRIMTALSSGLTVRGEKKIGDEERNGRDGRGALESTGKGEEEKNREKKEGGKKLLGKLRFVQRLREARRSATRKSRAHRKQDSSPPGEAEFCSSDSGENYTGGKLSTKATTQPTPPRKGKKGKKTRTHACTHRSAAADVPEEINGRIGIFAWKNGHRPASGNSSDGISLLARTSSRKHVKTNYFRTYHRSPSWCGKLTRYCLTGTAMSLATAETKQASKFPTHLEACLLFTASRDITLRQRTNLTKSLLCVTPRITLAIPWQQLP